MARTAWPWLQSQEDLIDNGSRRMWGAVLTKAVEDLKAGGNRGIDAYRWIFREPTFVTLEVAVAHIRGLTVESFRSLVREHCGSAMHRENSRERDRLAENENRNAKQGVAV